jgi:hypothetical protein
MMFLNAYDTKENLFLRLVHVFLGSYSYRKARAT